MKITLSSLIRRYHDEEQAWIDLESLLWSNGPICPHCGVINHAYYLKPKNGQRTTRIGNVSYRRIWKCAECWKKFSVIKGTIFEDTHIPLSKWMIAIYLFNANKNGIAAYELHRELEITQEAAWFMMHRIRHAIALTDPKPVLTGTVEADETYIGGKRKQIPGVGATELKAPVVTLVQRDGEARSQVVPDVTGKNIREILWKNIDSDASLMTDESNVYAGPGRVFASHETVDHHAEEWVRGKAHVNTAEGYFSQLKRSLDGTHHHVSRQHLHRYVGEFDWRYSMRKQSDSDRTNAMIGKTRGKRLMYRDTAGKQDS